MEYNRNQKLDEFLKRDISVLPGITKNLEVKETALEKISDFEVKERPRTKVPAGCGTTSSCYYAGNVSCFAMTKTEIKKSKLIQDM